ncbi:hypothetical protein LSM04_001216 [Trypanosoma melophagium]|nr:hypothetical protein LSM04_001216 [Trypanosoma melophagium]
MPRRSGRRTGISTRPTRLRLECDRVQDEPPGVLVYIGAPRCREPSLKQHATPRHRHTFSLFSKKMSCDHEDTWRLKGGQSPPDDLDGDSIECLFLKNSKKTSSKLPDGERTAKATAKRNAEAKHILDLV